MSPSLVTAGRQQDLSGEGKNSAPKEGILFINTFDLGCRHTALFLQKSHCVHLSAFLQVAQPSRPLASHPLGFLCARLCLAPIKW